MSEATEHDTDVESSRSVDPAKVTLSSASVYPRKVGYAFELAAELGYDGIEVMVWGDSTTQDDNALAHLSQRSGMTIRSIHAPTLLISQNVWGPRPAPKLAKTVDMALTLGASTVVVHPPFAWQRAYARQFVEQVRTLSAESGVTIAVENMYPWRSKRHDYGAYLPGWDPTEHPYDSVTLDLSHAATARQDSLALAQSFGSRLRHVHLADGSGSGKDEHLVPGRGGQPCAELLAHLGRTGWSGDIVVEIGTRKARTATERRDDVAASLSFARRNLAAGRAGECGGPVNVQGRSVKPLRHPHERPTDAW